MKAFLVMLVSALSCTVAQAQPSDPTFLEPGKDYLIHFASEELAFKSVTVSEKPILEIFKVVRLGKDASWAELEYPRDRADYADWNRKRKAMALLTETNIKDLEASEEGQEELKKLRERAADPIQTKRSWINLDYVFQISEVPKEFPDTREVKISGYKFTTREFPDTREVKISGYKFTTRRIPQADDQLRLDRRPNEQPLINDIQVPKKTEEQDNADKP